MEHRSDDIHGLRKTLSGAWEVRVFDVGCLHYDSPTPDDILGEEPVFVLNAPGDVAQLVDLLAVESVGGSMCMCPGEAALEFLDSSGGRVAAVGLHGGRRVRWSGWSGDADLQHGIALLEWLAPRGLGELLDNVRRSDIRRDIALAEQAAWKATVPACAQSFAEDMITAGPWEPEVAGDVAERMAVAYPDETLRCRSLLAWFSAGTGACTGYPTYEDVPGGLIKAMPIETVLSALEGEPVSGPVWAGGLRHIAGWKTRADHELRRIPAPVWDQLLELGRFSGDIDKRQRIERKHVEFRLPA